MKWGGRPTKCGCVLIRSLMRHTHIYIYRWEDNIAGMVGCGLVYGREEGGGVGGPAAASSAGTSSGCCTLSGHLASYHPPPFNQPGLHVKKVLEWMVEFWTMLRWLFCNQPVILVGHQTPTDQNFNLVSSSCKT